VHAPDRRLTGVDPGAPRLPPPPSSSSTPADHPPLHATAGPRLPAHAGDRPATRPRPPLNPPLTEPSHPPPADRSLPRATHCAS
jgi:hypothetical protein